MRARVRATMLRASVFFGDFISDDGSVRLTFFLIVDDRRILMGPPVIDELSLPPSLVRSLLEWRPGSGCLVSQESEQQLIMLESHEAFPIGSSNPQLLAYPPLLLLSARCRTPAPFRTAALNISTPLSLPSALFVFMMGIGSCIISAAILVSRASSHSLGVGEAARDGGDLESLVSKEWLINW